MKWCLMCSDVSWHIRDKKCSGMGVFILFFFFFFKCAFADTLGIQSAFLFVMYTHLQSFLLLLLDQYLSDQRYSYILMLISSSPPPPPTHTHTHTHIPSPPVSVIVFKNTYLHRISILSCTCLAGSRPFCMHRLSGVSSHFKVLVNKLYIRCLRFQRFLIDSCVPKCMRGPLLCFVSVSSVSLGRAVVCLWCSIQRQRGTGWGGVGGGGGEGVGVESIMGENWRQSVWFSSAFKSIGEKNQPAHQLRCERVGDQAQARDVCPWDLKNFF